jgi:hypothetical protein
LVGFDKTLKEKFEDIKKGEYFLYFPSMIFKINYQFIIEKEDNILTEGSKNKPDYLKQMERHELKHIIDLYIGRNLPIKELSAELYDGCVRDEPLKKDINVNSFKLKTEAAELLWLEKETPGEKRLILEKQTNIAERTRKINRMRHMEKTLTMDFFNRLVGKGLKASTISFLVSLTAFDDLEETLRLVDNHYS